MHAGSYPAIVPRLVIPEAIAAPIDLAAERRLGRYAGTSSADLIEELEASGLRGRGGAGYPAHIKWRAVSKQAGRKIVVANGEEGEPSSCKDRWLMTHRPHLVLEGLLLAARACGAARAIVYLSSPDAELAIRAAIEELDTAGLLKDLPYPEVFVVEHTYVAGEETAVCRAINGGPALPMAKPPRPFESGVERLPTLVANVETLAHAAWIAAHGSAAFRRLGTPDSPGTALVTLAGACGRPGLYEIPFGISVEELVVNAGGGYLSTPRGFAMGGWFGGLIDAPHGRDLICEFASCKVADRGWGCGAITVLGADDDPIAFAAEVSAWYVKESARQCGVCIKGTASIAQAINAIKEGSGTTTDAQNLLRWGQTLRGRGACAFLDGAAMLARSLATSFPLPVVCAAAQETLP